MPNPSQLGICVIGTGRAGMIHARNLAFGRVAHATLACVVDSRWPARQPVRKCSSIGSMQTIARRCWTLASTRW